MSKNKMTVAVLIASIIISGCGYSQKGNEAVGQVKFVVNETPLICPNYSAVSLSFGVMRNGVGSMSNHDETFEVADPALVAQLKDAAESGKLVNVKSDERRFTFCVPNDLVTGVEIIDGQEAK